MRVPKLVGLLLLVGPAVALAQPAPVPGQDAQGSPPQSAAAGEAVEDSASPEVAPAVALAGLGDAPAVEAVGAEPQARHRFDGKLEATVEADSNLARRESSDEEQQSWALPVLRVGAEASMSLGWANDQRLFAAVGANLRAAPSSEIVSEDLAQLSLDAQWTRPARQDAIRAGLRVSGRDALSLHGVDGDRTFRMASADLTLVLFGEDARVSVGVGPRAFQYKASGTLSWIGGGAQLGAEVPLWSRDPDRDDASSLDLTVRALVEQRAYFGNAASNCLMGEEITPDCIATTPRRRGDQVLRSSIGVIYTGAVVASVEGQVTSLDSNSFSQSWQGVRLRAALTAPLGELYASLTATVSAERYPDGLLVRKDASTYESLDSDDRSSLELRLARPGERAELELRVAMWRDLFRDTAYRRYLVSIGFVLGR